MKKYREKGWGIDYKEPQNKLILELAKQGLSVFCIWREVNRHLYNRRMSEGQVYYRIRNGGSPLSMVRDGKTPESQDSILRVVIKLYPRIKRKAV